MAGIPVVPVVPGVLQALMVIMVVLIGGTGGTTMTDWPWKTNLANTGPTGRYHPAAPNPVEYHRYHQSHQKQTNAEELGILTNFGPLHVATDSRENLFWSIGFRQLRGAPELLVSSARSVWLRSTG